MSGGLTDGTADLSSGALTPDGHLLPIRIYYEDTDFSGAVYHGSYVRFLERGRSEFLRAIGVSHRSLGADGLHFAVSELQVRFRRAARIDDVVSAVTSVSKLTGARVVLDQAIRRGDEVLVEAVVSVALIDASGRPRRFPESVTDALVAQADRR